jgi:hypothetical protein
VVYTDSKKAFIYDIMSGKTEVVDPGLPAGHYLVSPMIENDVMVWTEFVTPSGPGVTSKQTPNPIARLFGADVAYAAGGNSLVAYDLARKAVMSTFALVDGSGNANPYLAQGVLYFDDTIPSGLRVLYAANVSTSPLAQLAAVISTLPQTGIATGVYLLLAGALGYFILRGHKTFLKKRYRQL